MLNEYNYSTPGFSPSSETPLSFAASESDLAITAQSTAPDTFGSVALIRILESGGDALIVLDADWRCVYVNAAALPLLTKDQSVDVAGKAITDLFPHVMETVYWDVYNRAIREQAMRTVEYYFQDADKWFDIHALPHDGFLYLHFRDITPRKHLEAERERLLADALERAERDPLTGLLNHNAFYERLRAETAYAAKHPGRTVTLILFDLDNFKFFNEAFGHLGGDQLLTQVADALRSCCREQDLMARLGGDEFALLLIRKKGNTREAERVAERACSQVERVGFVPPGGGDAIPLTFSFGMAVFPNEANSATELAALADQRLLTAKRGEQIDGLTAALFEEEWEGTAEGFWMLNALVTTVNNKDGYTRRHSEDVLMYALMIADQMGMDLQARHSLRIAALLHDVGKIGVPDRLLRLPAPLSDEEYAQMKQHSAMGAAIIGAVPGLEHTLPAVRHHHESWDGSGYPDHLAGEAIPLHARILAVADAFSAMTTNRPYRRGMTREKALTVLQAGAGKQWDARCVAALVRFLTESGSVSFPLPA